MGEAHTNTRYFARTETRKKRRIEERGFIVFGGHFFLFQVKRAKRLRGLKKGKDASRDARKGPGENVFM